MNYYHYGDLGDIIEHCKLKGQSGLKESVVLSFIIQGAESTLYRLLDAYIQSIYPLEHNETNPIPPLHTVRLDSRSAVGAEAHGRHHLTNLPTWPPGLVPRLVAHFVGCRPRLASAQNLRGKPLSPIARQAGIVTNACAFFWEMPPWPAWRPRHADEANRRAGGGICLFCPHGTRMAWAEPIVGQGGAYASFARMAPAWRGANRSGHISIACVLSSRLVTTARRDHALGSGSRQRSGRSKGPQGGTEIRNAHMLTGRSGGHAAGVLRPGVPPQPAHHASRHQAREPLPRPLRRPQGRAREPLPRPLRRPQGRAREPLPQRLRRSQDRAREPLPQPLRCPQ
eukprot:1189961-Prorocentrum_minimum.AAC.2